MAMPRGREEERREDGEEGWRGGRGGGREMGKWEERGEERWEEGWRVGRREGRGRLPRLFLPGRWRQLAYIAPIVAARSQAPWRAQGALAMRGPGSE